MERQNSYGSPRKRVSRKGNSCVNIKMLYYLTREAKFVSKWGKLNRRSVTSPFFPTQNKVPKMWVGYVGVCLREITSWLWINQERNDRSSCHYVEKHDLFISVCDYSCDGKCDLRCVTTNIISLTALAHYRTKRQPFCLAPSECASVLIV